MDISDYKNYEPLFGCWVITRLLEQNANQMLFEIEHKDAKATQKAVMRVVFIPRKHSGIQILMEQMGRRTEPAAFLQEMVDTVKRELVIRQRLEGQPHIVASTEQKIIERGDKTGIDVLMRLEYLIPLSVYLQRQDLTEEILLRLGADICSALESCRQAGVHHGNICEDAVFVTSDGMFKLGRFEKADMAENGGAVPKDAEAARGAVSDVKNLGWLLRKLAQRMKDTLSPEAGALIQRLCRTSTADVELTEIHRKFERLARKSELPAQKGKKETAAPEALAAGQTRRIRTDAANTAQMAAAPKRSAAALPAEPLKAPGPAPAVQPQTAAKQNEMLFEKVAEGYEIQNESETTAPKSKIKWLAVAVCGLFCFAVLGFVGVRFAIPAIRGVLSAADDADPEGVPAETQAPPAETEQDQMEEPAAVEPTLSPEEAEAVEREQRIQQVLETMQNICTNTQPQVTDPATWNEAGRALMDRLEADPYYREWRFTASVAAFAAGGEDEGLRADMSAAIGQWQEGAEVPLAEEYPYLIAVNRAASTVTVYTPDEEGRYTVPYMAMVCSGGPGTPTGFWFTPIRYQWRTLVGPCYGQNATRIWNSYLFHSVPYYTQHKDDVEYDQYNQLGTQASLGCIRLAVVDVKWIFDNCPLGTPVVIYDDENDPGPMGKPGTIYTDPANTETRGWDPTDPDPANPWGDEFLPGTAIRSEAAWEEYNAAMADGRWNDTINITDLRGESTDSTVEGTRG